MSTAQRITLIGMYNYLPSLFDGLTLPEGYDKQDFIDSLLLEHGEKCVLYTNPDFMASAIGVWGRKWAGNLERIYMALTEEYNPLHNFDRYEEVTDNEGRKYASQNSAGHTATDKPQYSDTQTNANTDTRTHANTDTRTHADTDTTTNDFDVVHSTIDQRVTEHTVSADNSSAYQADWKEMDNGGTTKDANDGTITNAHTGTITDGHTGTITDGHTGTIKHDIAGTTQNLTEKSNSSESGSDTHNLTHHGHLYGNIGVTTSVQMLTTEVDARMKYNLYEAAGRLFANELLIGIY